jgi:hypothetical protein
MQSNMARVACALLALKLVPAVAWSKLSRSASTWQPLIDLLIIFQELDCPRFFR